jgi:ubiquitin C-terminal hydrolase
MNASLQCLLALGKLRTIILGPDASDARLGTMGLELKWLFQETSSVNNARRMLDPQTILGCMQSLYQDRFEVGKMEDSHEFLTLFHTGLDNEVEELNRSHVLEGGGVFPTFGHSIFSSQLIQTISCKSCSYNSVSLPSVHGLQLGVPSKASPARSKPLQVGKSMRSCT